MKGILSAIIFVPLFGAVILGFIPRTKEAAIKWVSLIFTIIPFVLSIIAWLNYDVGTAGIQFAEKMPWIKDLGISYNLGVDGLSLPLVVLSTLTMVASVLYSFIINKRTKEYFVLMLIMASSMVGVFIALDYILFYIFWEIGLIPMYFLIGIWGGPRREHAAIKFFLYTFFGSIFMLVAILGLYFYAPESARSFDMIALAKNGYSMPIQIFVFIGVFLAMAIKLPLFPFHTWLPDAHVEAPTAASVILAGVLLKMGGYGIARILMPTVPDAFEKFVPLMAAMGIISIVYAAYLAMSQDDLKKMVAYSSISHMGFVILGFAAFNVNGITGATFQMVSHGLITGMMFILVGMVYDSRYHTRKISQLKTLMGDAPALSFVIILTTFASLGMPAFSGFIGEWLSIAGVFSSEFMGQSIRISYSILMAIGIILTAGYFIFMMARVFLKDTETKYATPISDLNGRELTIAVPLIGLFILFGIYPKPILVLIQSAMKTMIP